MDQDLPELITPPAHTGDLAPWRAELRAWRQETRVRLKYDGAAYASPKVAWVPQCFSCAMVMVWDEGFLDHRTGNYHVEEVIAEGKRVFGGFDAVVLWQAYPRIGFDDRNQFDYYRELPGGLAGLRGAVDRFHAAGVRVFVDYNPWDVGTRREDKPDRKLLADLVGSIGANGIFLDTLNRGSIELRDAVRKDVVFESELALPVEGVPLNHLSWAQWFDNGQTPGLLRNRWFEQRHMMHVIRRWDTEHIDEIHLAWMNGAGMLVWENVFGSWNGWSAQSRSLLKTVLTLQRRFSRHFSAGVWTPFLETAWEGVFASSWELDGSRLWTLVNRSGKPVNGELVAMKRLPGTQLLDLIAGGPLAKPQGFIADGGIGALLEVPEAQIAGELGKFLFMGAHHRPEREGSKRIPHALPIADHRPHPPSGASEAGMLAVPAGEYSVTTHYRVRECGERGYGRFENLAYPRLHFDTSETRTVTIDRFELMMRDVTNREYSEFLTIAHYEPELGANFLRHWEHGRPKAADLDLPVVYVDLRDARAYAAWKGLRLPTDAEWQLAMERHKPDRGLHPVWNWTDNEYADGHTRFVLLKGGSWYEAKGSEWYADGGLREPNFAAKFIEFWPGLDRCATIGFRCARTLA